MRLDEQAFAAQVLVESFRDWGRDCWCAPGKENTCGKRFDWQLGELPHGYDHKYIYSHVGYNLKATDMQAAVGVAQLKKLPAFIAARKRNFAYLTAGLKDKNAAEHFMLAGSNCEFRSQLVWVSAAATRDGSVLAQHAYGFFEREKDCYSPTVRWKPGSPTCLCRS
jgi:dTDP-4-amino-4,6-dideoxygalactose transaminase